MRKELICEIDFDGQRMEKINKRYDGNPFKKGGKNRE